VFSRKPIANEANGKSDAVRSIDLIQCFPSLRE
jgi:hypothetical protein